MCFSQFIGKVVSEVSLQTFCEFLVLHYGTETACTLLVCSVDAEGCDLDTVSFQFLDIGFEDGLKYPVLISWLFPLTVRYAKPLSIVPGCFRHDLVSPVGTTFFIFNMVAARTRLYLDDLLHDLFKCFVIYSGIFCYVGISGFSSGSAQEEYGEQCKCRLGKDR